MATVMGAVYHHLTCVMTKYTLHLINDPEDGVIAEMLEEINGQIYLCGFSRDEYEGNVDLLSRKLLNHRLNSYVRVEKYVSQIDLTFVKQSIPWEIQSRDQESSGAAALPDSQQKSVAEKVKDQLAEKADRLVSVSKATEELMERYAAEMERDPDLREALTRLLESEKINALDS